MTEMETTTTKTNHYYIGALAALVALVASILALVVAHPAQAAFPGANGKIAFQSGRDGNDEIYKMNPDGTRQRNLTRSAASDTNPAYSPDGTKIAFRSDRRGNDEIHVMNALDGSSPKRLTTNVAIDVAPDWGVRTP